MNKPFLTGRYAVSISVLSVAAAALSAPAALFAGPGCMHDQRLSKSPYPYSPPGPQAVYGYPAPYGFQTGPYGYSRMMALPYSRPADVQQRYAAAAPVPAPTPQVEASEGQPVADVAGNDMTPAAESVTVRINGMRFEPANITVKPGATVIWVQDSTMPHSISGTNGGLRSDTLSRGQQFSYTFDQSGRFEYACGLHPSMKGSIVVEEAGLDS